MSILTELKKLTKKKNATVVSQALPDSLDGSGSGGGGANVLTLYLGHKNDDDWCYKNSERTEEYLSYEEAKNAIENADIIEVEMEAGHVFYPTAHAATKSSTKERVFVVLVSIDDEGGIFAFSGPLWSKSDSGGGK